MLQQKKTPVSHIVLDLDPGLEKAVILPPRIGQIPERTLHSSDEISPPPLEHFNAYKANIIPIKS